MLHCRRSDGGRWLPTYGCKQFRPPTVQRCTFTPILCSPVRLSAYCSGFILYPDFYILFMTNPGVYRGDLHKIEEPRASRVTNEPRKVQTLILCPKHSIVSPKRQIDPRPPTRRQQHRVLVYVFFWSYRAMCGVHFRMDSVEGLHLGETVGVRMLQQVRNHTCPTTYHQGGKLVLAR